MVNLPDDVTEQELEVFLADTNEQIRILDESIARLEYEGDDFELLQDVFRAAHTIKGSSAMLGYPMMAELSYAMANVLDRLRKGTLPFTSEIAGDLVQAMDHLRLLRDNLISEVEADVDIAEVVVSLQELAACNPDVGTCDVSRGRLSQSHPFHTDDR